jgi:hypothetical protein
MRRSTGIPSAAAEACGFLSHDMSTPTKVDGRAFRALHVFAKTVAEMTHVRRNGARDR